MIVGGMVGGAGTAPGTVIGAPQSITHLGRAVGGALLWGCIAVFAPTQPAPVAAEWLTGTHQLVIAQSQNRSAIQSPFRGPSASTTAPFRTISAGPQFQESPRGFLNTPQPAAAVGASPPIRALWAPGQYPEPRPSWVKGPQIDAAPFLSFTVEALPQDPPQLKALVFGQPPPSSAAVTSVLRAAQISAPQSDPTQAKPLVFGQVPPTALTPPIRAFNAAPQTDPSQLKSLVWNAPPLSQQATPAIHFLQASPQLIDLTQQANLWHGLPVVSPPIRPFSAGPQRIDLTQQPQWMRQPPANTPPTPPPNMPFKAGPLSGEVAHYSRGYSYVWGAPPPTATVLEIVPYLIEDSLSAALMRIASIFGVASVTGTTGSVTLQSPAAFSLVPRGTTIFITLGGTVHTGGSGRSRAQSPYGSPDAIPPWSLTRKH